MVTKFSGISKEEAAHSQRSRQVQAWLQQAVALHRAGRLSEAQSLYQEILRIQPRHFDSLHLSGVIAMQMGHCELGLELMDQALQINPHAAAAYNNRGKVLKDLGRLEAALVSFNQALALKAAYPEAFNNRGNLLLQMQRPDDALASYDNALALKPEDAETYNNRGNALQHLHRLDEALASYEQALALRPHYAEAYYNRGNALKGLQRLEEALASYEQALSLRPLDASIHYNRGNVLSDLQRLDEALFCYRKALSIDPGQEFLFGAYLHTKMRLCEWDALTEELHKLESDITHGRKATTPFPLLALVDDPALHKMATRLFSEAKYPRNQALGSFAKRISRKKIRIGYYSSDFHEHATAYLIAQLLEEHDARRFEVYGFSFGAPRDDGMRKRLSAALTRFIDVRSKTDLEIARLSRELEIDIAIDLKGYTQNSRPGIFALGCAPIQVNYLGYPGTLAAEHIDYVIADKTLLSRENQSCFTEKVVTLPFSYQANDSKRSISTRSFTRQELGLPEEGFVFCSFNNNYKILPATLDGWARIMNAVEGSVLWLLEDNPTAARNLRREAAARGIDNSRLVFAPRMPLDEHLARHKLADLFLDTLPCNAHTTASDALWAGLPVLTCTGSTFASRVAASLLHAIDLPELVTSTQEEYERKAMELATNPAQVGALKDKLQANRSRSPLFDGRQFARHIEAAYEAMVARHEAGLPPAAIELSA